jgi:hypothetical protein
LDFYHVSYIPNNSVKSLPLELKIKGNF